MYRDCFWLLPKVLAELSLEETDVCELVGLDARLDVGCMFNDDSDSELEGRVEYDCVYDCRSGIFVKDLTEWGVQETEVCKRLVFEARLDAGGIFNRGSGSELFLRLEGDCEFRNCSGFHRRFGGDCRHGDCSELFVADLAELRLEELDVRG